MNALTEIKNFELGEFFKQSPELITDYVEILKHVQPIQTKNEIFHLKLKDVEFIKEHLMSNSDEEILDIISKVQGLKPKEVMKIKIVEFFGLMNSIKEQIIQINKAEASSLVSDHVNFKWEAVNGSERLQKFGIYNTLDSLSDGDILKWNAIMELPYSDVFMKLLINKTQSDLSYEMNQIKEIKTN
ncbi:hypothetical protein [Bizionia psychrotolerans]|uniref:hypothetical protein n=1 Tax=Bizionia psychrotolerans TaxID=1492901 RepID=UPI0006508111|nr:hypothetical protein [Bizionia psychrotolerans]